jgi:argininosuccinate synthase
VYTAEIGFKNGLPVSLGGKFLPPAELLGALNTLAGRAGIGVVDLLEERANGIKSRGVYETPGGTLLHQACRNLKHLCWDRSLLSIGRTMGEQFGLLVYDGLWHSDARASVNAFFEKASETLEGTITLKLEGGQSRVVSRQSPYAIYDEQMVSFESDQAGLHHFADGYCKTVCFGSMRAGKRDARTQRTIL